MAAVDGRPPHRFLTIGLLVLLEGLLSADNALVLAILVLGLPRSEQRKALRYGILGAFAFRILATLLAVHLIRVAWVKLLGACYLLYLTLEPLLPQRRRGAAPSRQAGAAVAGLSAFWATVVKVELTDIVFAVDSILVAVAMSPKTWVIISGGMLGIVDDAAGDRAAAVAGAPLSGAGGRRLRDHRVGRASSC